jgi:GNAT superfamily N-acetyltransferase
MMVAATVEAGQYLVATGAAPWIPRIGGLAGAGYLTSTTAIELTELPESMLVIGGNAVGLELAQLFARLGVQVTIAETLDRPAPFDEPEVSAAIEDVFDGEGIGILTAATVMSVRGGATARSVAIKTAGGHVRRRPVTDVLVRDDAMSFVVDQDEFGEMLGRGVISAAEGRGAEHGLQELLDLIQAGRLLRWLSEFAPFGPCQPPPARRTRRGPVPGRLQPGTRRTW